MRSPWAQNLHESHENENSEMQNSRRDGEVVGSSPTFGSSLQMSSAGGFRTTIHYLLRRYKIAIALLLGPAGGTPQIILPCARGNIPFRLPRDSKHARPSFDCCATRDKSCTSVRRVNSYFLPILSWSGNLRWSIFFCLIKILIR